jgi:hypothetical protein
MFPYLGLALSAAIVGFGIWNAGVGYMYVNLVKHLKPDEWKAAEAGKDRLTVSLPWVVSLLVVLLYLLFLTSLPQLLRPQ